jgi:hypothetical protein
MLRLQHSDTQLAECAGPIELPMEADTEKNSTIMLSLYFQRQDLKCRQLASTHVYIACGYTANINTIQLLCVISVSRQNRSSLLEFGDKEAREISSN